MSHIHRKKWGQNFLIDDNISKKIVDLLNIKVDDLILEIGPGKGSLTKHIIKKTKNIHLVEIDPRLSDELSVKMNYANISNVDILKYNISSLKNFKVIGNIPYNITTPIIFKFLDSKQWSKMILMTQREVANRIIAKPNSKTYGRLSVMCQAFANVKIEFNVSKNVFYPKPKVDSSIIKFRPNKVLIPDVDKFSSVVKYAFSQRRKKIKNNLNNMIPKENYAQYADKRAEELSVSDFIKISSN